MIALLDNSQDLDACRAELGCDVGQLLTSHKRPLRFPDQPWAIDNHAYAGFNTREFMVLLGKHAHHKDKCIFVTVPDVVGSARRTLEIFHRWKDKLTGWPLALACQDGQEDLEIPWDEISAVFIGGSTNWKGSTAAADIVRAGKILDKWVHIGRINTPGRFEHFIQLGANSFDGSGVAKYTHMRNGILNRHDQGALSLLNGDNQ